MEEEFEYWQHSLFSSMEILPSCVSHSSDKLVGLCLSEVSVPWVLWVSWQGLFECPGRGDLGALTGMLWVPHRCCGCPDRQEQGKPKHLALVSLQHSSMQR